MTATSSNYVDFLLGQLTCAGLRARLIVTEIDSATAALRGGLINPESAMEWVADIGALGLITLMSSAITTTSTQEK